MIARIAPGLLAAALALAAAPGCTSKDGAAREEASRAVFRRAVQKDLSTWDPALAYDAESLSVLGAVYETLYQPQYLSESHASVPLLAADVPRLSMGGRVAVIPLRQGVRYHDGRELKAGDFVHSFKRVLDPKTASPGRFVLEDLLTDVSADDDRTLRLKLKRPAPHLLAILSHPMLAPLPADATNEALARSPVGTGPFKLQAWERGRQISFVRNASFHPDFFPTNVAARFRSLGATEEAGRILPQTDGARLEVIADRQLEWKRFREGALDAVRVTGPVAARALTEETGSLRPELAREGIRLHEEPSPSFYFLVFNPKDPTLGGPKGKLLRQAISSAIDRARWIEVAAGSAALGSAMTSVFPEAVLDSAATDRKLRFGYDPERARQLLARAGHPAGKGLPELKLELRGSDETNRRLGELFKEQLGAVGIRAVAVTHSLDEYLALERAGTFQIGYGGWALDFAAAENVVQRLRASGFRSGELDVLYEKLSVAQGNTRAESLARIDALVQEESPWVLGYSPRTVELTQPWVRGFRAGEVTSNPLKYLRIDVPSRLQALKKR